MTFPPRIFLHGPTTVKQKHDSFALDSPISTVLTVECFLEVILSIYHFKRVNFLFENGTLESKTLKQYGHVYTEAFSVPPRNY